MIKNLLLIGLGGGVGSILRYLLSLSIQNYLPLNRHYLATLTINFLGSLIIGIGFYQMMINKQWQEKIGYLLIVGFCGGFTTFSTFAYENFVLINNQQYLQFIIYTLLSVCFCIGGVALGFFIFKN